MSAKVSIVVPMYGVEKYVGECIESIQNQTLSDIEIILVDDGSPDRSGEIAEEYSQKDFRIKVVHQKNAGLGPARNTGIKHATGEYVGFVDSDDWIKPEMFERLYTAAQTNKSDIVISGHCDYTNGVKTRTKKHYLAGTTLSQKKDIMQVRKNLFGHSVDDSTVDAFPMSVWIAIYRRDYLNKNNLCFEEILSEDIVFNLSAYKYAEVITFTGDTDYCYRKDNQPSIMKTFSEKKQQRYTDFMSRVMQLALLENDDECVMRARRTAIDFTRLYVGLISDSNLPFAEKKKYVGEFAENSLVRELWSGYPMNTLPKQQKLYQKLLESKCYGSVLLLNYVRLKLKRIWH